jgi:hypothetical protein
VTVGHHQTLEQLGDLLREDHLAEEWVLP